MIYWFSGENQNCNRILAKKLVDFLKTEKRNWRRSVYYIDETEMVESAIIISKYLDKTDTDVVVSLCDNISYNLTNLPKHTEISVYKGKNQYKSHSTDSIIKLETSYTTVQSLFLTLISKLTDANKI